MSNELIWLTIPHQLPPTATWYKNKQQLIYALNEHELHDDMRDTINDFDELIHWASMQYNSTRVIDWNDYQALKSGKHKLGHHQKHKAQIKIENIANILGWK